MVRGCLEEAQKSSGLLESFVHCGGMWNCVLQLNEAASNAFQGETRMAMSVADRWIRIGQLTDWQSSLGNAKLASDRVLRPTGRTGPNRSAGLVDDRMVNNHCLQSI